MLFGEFRLAGVGGVIFIYVEEELSHRFAEIADIFVADFDFAVPQFPVRRSADSRQLHRGIVIIPGEVRGLCLGLDFEQHAFGRLGPVGGGCCIILLPERYQGVVFFVFRYRR